MKRVKMYVAIVLLIFVVVVMGRIAFQIDDWGRDWTTNHASMQSLTLDASADELVDRIRAWADQRSAWTVQSVDRTDDQAHVHLTRRTAFLRFTDDVHVQIKTAGSEHPSQVIVDAESQSRVGKGDLGQNPRNLAELKAALTANGDL